MGVDEKNRNETISRIVAELFVKSTGGEDLSAKIRRLRDEINKVIEGENTIFGKFRGLVESFREVIPEEHQRYNAALKGLSTTARLSRQEIVAAVNNQLAELKVLEKSLLSAVPGWSDELRAMEAKSREMREEITKLHEILARLENEEKGILNDMASRKKEMELVEKAVGELFTVMGAEITYIRKKVEESADESPASQPVPGEGKGGGEQKIEVLEPAAPAVDSEFQKKCPMCGGRMNFHSIDQMWLCYSCAHEESEKK